MLNFIKVYSMEELHMIADLCKKYDVLVFADEVYEWLIYQPNQHIKIGENVHGSFSSIFKMWSFLSSSQQLYKICGKERSPLAVPGKLSASLDGNSDGPLVLKISFMHCNVYTKTQFTHVQRLFKLWIDGPLNFEVRTLFIAGSCGPWF
jgi:hypothetical protein